MKSTKQNVQQALIRKCGDTFYHLAERYMYEIYEIFSPLSPDNGESKASMDAYYKEVNEFVVAIGNLLLYKQKPKKSFTKKPVNRRNRGPEKPYDQKLKK